MKEKCEVIDIFDLYLWKYYDEIEESHIMDPFYQDALDHMGIEEFAVMWFEEQGIFYVRWEDY